MAAKHDRQYCNWGELSRAPQLRVDQIERNTLQPAVCFVLADLRNLLKRVNRRNTTTRVQEHFAEQENRHAVGKARTLVSQGYRLRKSKDTDFHGPHSGLWRKRCLKESERSDRN